jgi:hypothetical protein
LRLIRDLLVELVVQPCYRTIAGWVGGGVAASICFFSRRT